ncbi:MAG: hypothetical protein CR982_00315 [Candidatus Cloacimonadota bacterium]|nr:MAG: hypothetical protein CR982_00315 [Candidatus Cloacimonadota bacterium]PIE79149.1 MAG: hypothetical protein CSA15_04560 [Candidatus Delongbacteria bacterium]
MKENQLNNVQKQINELDKEILLFLHNLEEINIESPKIAYQIRKRVNIIEIIENNEIVEKKEWEIESRVGKYEGKNFELKIAYSDSLDDDKNILYSFFRTNVSFPFPALVHGTFELNENRNHLIDDDSGHNKYLLTELIQLMIDTAKKISKSSQEVSWKALKLLSVGDFADETLKQLDFKEKLLQKIKENELIPLVSNSYKSFNDEIYIYEKPYAHIIKNLFPSLAIYTKDKQLIDFIKKNLGDLPKIDTEIFFNKISNFSNENKLSKLERSKLIKFIYSDYKKYISENKSFPELFIDEDEKVIPSDTVIFFPSNSENVNIPNFIKLKYINSMLLKFLKSIFEKEDSLDLAKKLEIFNIKKDQFEDIIYQIIDKTNERIEDQPKQEEETVKKFINSMYQNFLQFSEKIDISKLNKTIPLLNRNKKLVYMDKSKHIFFGNEYNNEILENILSSDKFLANYQNFGLVINDEKNTAYKFFEWLGVKKSIPIEETDPYTDEISGYKEYLKEIIRNKAKNYSHLENLDYDTELRIRNNEHIYIYPKIITIKDLKKILEKKCYLDIIIWLLRDNIITKHIGEKYENSLYLGIKVGSQRSKRFITNFHQPSSFIWQLKNSNWIETTNGKKAKPKECVYSENIPKELIQYIETPKINYEDPILKKYEISKDEIKDLFSKIGITDTLNNISVNTIFNLLLKIENINLENQIIKKFYNLLAKEYDRDDLESYEYNEFKNKGKVLSEKDDQICFRKSSDVFYIPNSSLPKDLVSKLPKIYMSNIYPVEKVQKLFCLNTISKAEIKLDNEPLKHRLHSQFSKDFAELKPYIYSYIVDNDLEEKIVFKLLKKLEIILCENISATTEISERKLSFNISNYESLRFDNKIYIRIDRNFNSISDLKENFNFLKLIPKIIYEIIEIENLEMKYRELYSSKEKYRRDILKEHIGKSFNEKLEISQKLFGNFITLEERFWITITDITKKRSNIQDGKY